MDGFSILAQAAVEISSQATGGIVPIDLFWNQITELKVVESLTFISFGVVCLFYGWRVFKILVIINFSLLGLMLGMFITEKISGLNNEVAGGLLGMVILGVLSVPLMRWSVSILGALAGGTLAAALWIAVGLSQNYIWAGMLTGIVAGGMVSFIIFKIAVMLFTSLLGSSLTAAGLLALLYIYPQTSKQVEVLVLKQNWFLPLVLILPTALGVYLQNRFVKGSKEWDL